MTEPLPKEIGRFQVQSELGRGGFGRVYKAYDPTVSRMVAIKVLTEGGKDILTRFQNEAMVAGNLHHENIVTVYEYGEHEEKPFLAMEFLEGEDLQQIINSKRPLSLMQKCQIMFQAAEGLHCAHRNGIIHRDVKPANIMVLPDGGTKIMDFGIARILRDAHATRLTREGYMLGTLLYMAPEQFNNATADALCDIFAYGVIFYELITGRHPFAASDSHVLMFKISMEEPPPLGSVIPHLPDALQGIVTRLLHKDRDLRYQSLKEVQLDMGPILIDLRQKQAGQLLCQAQELHESGELEEAQLLVQEILHLDPADQPARALWENLQHQLRARTLRPRVDSLLKKGDEQLAERRFDEALQCFERARRLDPDSGVIQGRIKQSRASRDRAQKAAELILASRRDFEQQNYTGAYKHLSEALRHDPENADAAAALESVRNAMEGRQREQRVDEAVAKVSALLALHSYDEAVAVLTGLGPDAGHRKAAGLLESVQAEKKRYEQEIRLLGEVAAVTELLRNNRFDRALEKLRILKEEYQENDEIAQLEAYAQRELAGQQRARRVEAIATGAGALLVALEFDRALEVIDQGLQQDPGESALIRLLGSAVAARANWEYRQAVQAALDGGAELRAQQRFAEAIQVVEAALRDYSGEARLLDLLQELERELDAQRRIEAIRSAAGHARKLLDRKQPEKAAQSLRQALARYPDESVLIELLEEAQNTARARALAEIGREAAACQSRNDFAGALSVMARGLDAWPGEGSLLRQQESLQEELENQRHAERAARVRGIAGEAGSMLSMGRFEHAIQLLQESLRTYSGEAALQSLLAQAEEEERRFEERAAAIEQLIGDVLRQVESEERDRHFTVALEMIRRALSETGDEPRLIEARQRLQAKLREQELRQARDRDLEELHRTEATARTCEPARAPEILIPATQAAGRHPEDANIRPAAAAAIRKRLLPAGGVAAIVAAVLAVLRAPTHQPNLIAVILTSAPPGAAITAGREVCTSPCTIKLKPGALTIEARLDGYRPAVRQVEVDHPTREPITLSLEPLHPQVRISTNFVSGTVQLDGASAGELRNGQLTLRDVAFGEHRLVVTSPDGGAAVAFETPAGRLPVSRGGIEAKATDAILVSSLGAQARLECNCGADPVTVDGKPAGMISANTLNLPALNKGNKTIQVGERALVIGAQPEPVVNLFLTSNQDIGTLVIDTNVDNPTVIINKKRYQGTASEGLIRIPLNAARYKVSLHKQGYRNSEPQTVDIQKGGAGKLLIRLDPVNSAIQMPAGVASADDHNALEEARRNDEQADWDGVNKSDRAALQQYLDQHPGGRFAQDASSLIKGLEQAEKQRADQQKRDDDQRKARLAEEQRKAQEALRKSAQEEEQRKKAGEAAAHQQQLETQQRAAAERRAVLDVLNKYAAAYKSRDAGAVKAVFPEVPKFNTIVNSFKIFRSFDVTLEPAEPQITGESAVVRCRRTIRVADEYGTQPPRSDAVTFRMQKLSDRWVIVSLQ